MKKLTEKRSELISELEKLASAAESGEDIRSYTDEEQTRMEEIRAEIEELDKTIAAKEQAMAVLAKNQPEIRSESDGENKLINAFVRNPASEQTRANETAIGQNTGVKYQQFSEDIIHGALDLCGVANLVNTVEARGTYKQIVSNSSYKITGAWTAEGVAPTVSEARWTTISIDPQKFTSECVVTYEMLNQAAFDVVPELLHQFTLDFAYGMEAGIIKGRGAATYNEPDGLVSGGTQYLTPAAGTFTTSDIVNIYHSLKSYYTQNAVWIMNNKTLSQIRQLVDGAGQFIFKQTDDFRNGYAGTILGKPVLVSEVMDDFEANESTSAFGKSPIFYGDFARGYKAIRNPDIQIQILSEKYAGVGTGVLGILWLGGKTINDEAYVRVDVNKASN